MLPPFIIEQIRQREEEKRRDDRPVLELPLEDARGNRRPPSPGERPSWRRQPDGLGERPAAEKEPGPRRGVEIFEL